MTASNPPWTQLVIETDRSPDEELLRALTPLLDAVKPRTSSWHLLWEPDLWIRFKWRSDADREAGERQIKEAMRSVALPHRLEPYEDEIDHFGADMWPLHERVLQVGAEMAVALSRAEGTPPHTPAFHWHRHVHLFSNQLHGTWTEETRRLLLQARYRAALMSRGDGVEPWRAALERMVETVERAIGSLEDLAAAEAAFLEGWRADGRPDLAERLHLSPDFHRDPSR